MRRLLLLVLALSVMTGIGFAQFNGTWDFTGAPVCGWAMQTDAGEAGITVPGFKNPYAVAIDPDGKIWAGAYYQRYWFDVDGVTKIWPDDIVDGTGAVVGSYPVFIYDPVTATYDSLIYLPMPDQSEDTLLSSGHRGFVRDPDGNIIVCHNGSGNIYKFNYQTYEVMDVYQMGGNLARPGIDAQGFLYHIDLLGGDVVILDPDDWSSPYNTIPAVAPGVSRAMEVSPDGQNVFIQRSGGGIMHFTGNVDDGFTIADTLIPTYPMQGVVQWDPAGLLWAAQLEGAAPNHVVVLDPDQGYAIVDTSTIINWGATDGSDTTWTNYHQPYYLRCPRDAAFNVEGTKMYYADMYSYAIKEWTYTPSSIGDMSKEVPGTFTLYHNYPNPFNPTTNITFDLHKNAHVKLKVYDSLGREVGTFIDGMMKAGSHSHQFNGANLASGTYYYKITVDTKVATGKMMLIK